MGVKPLCAMTVVTYGAVFLVGTLFIRTAFADKEREERADEENLQSVEDPLYDLLHEEQSVPGAARETAKVEKTYPAMGPVARRRGINPVLTTLFNVHSKEALPIFAKQLPSGSAVNELFRCRGFAFIKELDPRLLEAVLASVRVFESPRVNIISAYRSPKFNDSLSKKGRRVAAESRHTKGEAIDFSLITIDAEHLGKWLWDNFDGGVGTYKHDNFVHIDVGPRRRWQGK